MFPFQTLISISSYIQIINAGVISSSQGRVLYDLIVYNKGKGAGKPSYLLECDQEVTSELLALMKKYKIRKKVRHF